MSKRFAVFTVHRAAGPETFHGWREFSEATGLTPTALKRCVEAGSLPDGATVTVSDASSHPKMGRPQSFVRVKLTPDDIQHAKELAKVYDEDTESFLARLIQTSLRNVAAKQLGFRV
jgi:hypothetical protein